MVASRHLPVSTLDLIGAGVARNAENVVIVAHGAGITLPCSPVAEINECPLCGESMRLVARERMERVPGTGQTVTRSVREWVCPECDYWEEAESGSERS
jgi:YgiT-type zinc finger domain-containing protein